MGIYLKSSSQNNTAHHNRIYNNTDYGINATDNDGYTINAINNWWGDNSGPYHSDKNPEGKGDNVTDYVEFYPWLGQHLTLYVDDDAPLGGDGSKEHPFNRIRDAIDAAGEGDTVRVWGGLYEENVVVRKSVNLVGNSSEETTINAGGNGNVVKITADRVNLSGFMITGSGDGSAGIRVESEYNHIFRNNCSNNGYGISFYDAGYNRYNTISNNTFSMNNENGIYIVGWIDDITISNNSCNSNKGRGICLIFSHYNRGNRGSDYDNTISNNTCLNNSYGIYLDHSWEGMISNNTCNNNIYGIYLLESNHNTLTNNTCNNNTHGIYLGRFENKLLNNTCLNNSYGIYLDHSWRSMISNNICNNNTYGIRLHYSNNNTISNNICSNNRYGIFFSSLSSNKIENNSCSENDCSGIYFRSSNSNTLSNNKIWGNKVGISLESSSQNNSAHYNDIFNNTEYGINATDNGGYTINATYNWWGDESGPNHSVNNTEGKGDNVTDYVEFDPWVGKDAYRTKYVDDNAPAGGNGSKEHPF
ncbi:MAG: right-handed parallel beta-helix repeat-containing protein, partial [Thermoplasmata archaeon]|nr:right-handed parallel beta-helix repeat-containing protein [Thermoplasmata archaeon]